MDSFTKFDGYGARIMILTDDFRRILVHLQKNAANLCLNRNLQLSTH